MSEKSHLSKRLIPCLDVRNGRLTKGVKFKGNVDIGDPVETARRYYEEGADEIVFYDITASCEARGIFLDVVEKVASNIFIPFSVGGGIESEEDMRAVLLAGAEKVSVNSAAVKDPYLISRGADAFGSQAVVVGMDVKQVPVSETCPSGYEIVIHGGRRPMGIAAVRRMQQRSGSARATDEMCRLIVLNTASIQLLPTTVAAVRAANGAAAPFNILPAVWLTSVCSVTAGLLAALLFGRASRA